ncbi:hypothetical protein, partial [Janthinobacterium sp.]|uniref:hypothetical protein n=1 Tax=Janthinobacterium sp. TaxID=1871054 RepID=UPI002584FB16
MVFFIFMCCDWMRLCRRVGIHRKQKKALAQALSFLCAWMIGDFFGYVTVKCGNAPSVAFNNVSGERMRLKELGFTPME